MMWGGADVIIIEIKCTINVVCWSILKSPQSMEKNCLPWNWSLVPKRLGTAALKDFRVAPFPIPNCKQEGISLWHLLWESGGAPGGKQRVRGSPCDWVSLEFFTVRLVHPEPPATCPSQFRASHPALVPTAVSPCEFLIWKPQLPVFSCLSPVWGAAVCPRFLSYGSKESSLFSFWLVVRTEWQPPGSLRAEVEMWHLPLPSKETSQKCQVGFSFYLTNENSVVWLQGSLEVWSFLWAAMRLAKKLEFLSRGRREHWEVTAVMGTGRNNC